LERRLDEGEERGQWVEVKEE